MNRAITNMTRQKAEHFQKNGTYNNMFSACSITKDVSYVDYKSGRPNYVILTVPRMQNNC